MKVSVIGASGRVGKAVSFCLAEESVVSKIVLLSREKVWMNPGETGHE